MRAGLALVLVCSTAMAAKAQTPAEQRLAQLAKAVDKGDMAALRAVVTQSYAPVFRTQFGDEFHVAYLQSLRTNEGFRTGPIIVNGNRATTSVRNPVTEEIDSMFITVDSAQMVTMMRYFPGAGGSFATSQPRTDEERGNVLSAYVKKLAANDAFSGVILFAHNGRSLVFDAYGDANKDYSVPNRKDTKFNLGSANKNFTAVVIAQLVEEGKLSWEDPLSKFIPDFPDSAAAKKIKIKHLLSHTAGLGPYFTRTFIESSRARWRTVDDMMKLARPDTMRWEPGTAYRYSNTGFLVLGKVIEIVEGRSYYDVVRDRIYKPLGMTSTDSYELDRVNPNLAVGYTKRAGPNGIEYRNNVFEHVIRGGPQGGGFSNASDMLKYAEALRTGKLIKRNTLELMRSPKPELKAPKYGYGFALFESPQIWGHGGGFPGIDFVLNQYGDSGYTLIVMGNYDDVSGPIARKVKAMLEASGAVAHN